ncbi:MAG: L,D-transpeptidase family protein [Pseudomonadota bacterium]
MEDDSSLPQPIKDVYEAREYAPIWVGAENSARLAALMAALEAAGDHGLPVARYRIDVLSAALRDLQGPEAAAAEILATKAYLQYARDLTSGALEPKKVDKDIAVRPPRRAEDRLLEAVTKVAPEALFPALAPSNAEYLALLAEKKKLERKLDVNSGPSLTGQLVRQGSRGDQVVALRVRLAALGYGDLGRSEVFDRELRTVVRQFQRDKGLGADGIVGAGTLRALGGGSAKGKLESIIVALERERWLNRDRGQRHIIVNIADFSFNLYEDDKPVFHSIAVVGKGTSDRRTPEFHDEMTHMVVNPTWHVPPSIAGKEYLPRLKRNGGLRGMKVISRSGRVVPPGAVDFSKYSAKNFPFSVKQPPGPRNALGLVKFMFPNKYNIYLHDTPQKALFKREVRAFSHGCIRVQRPFEFAHELLSKQTANPKAAFEAFLKTGREQYVNLQTPVPVYLTYKTAFVGQSGEMEYRRDIYGRDKKIYRALVAAGLATPSADS